MQVKELLETLDLEKDRLNKQIEHDERNIRNRNTISAQRFYTNQIHLNKKYIKYLETTIQIIIMHVGIEDHPD